MCLNESLHEYVGARRPSGPETSALCLLAIPAAGKRALSHGSGSDTRRYNRLNRDARAAGPRQVSPTVAMRGDADAFCDLALQIVIGLTPRIGQIGSGLTSGNCHDAISGPPGSCQAKSCRVYSTAVVRRHPGGAMRTAEEWPRPNSPWRYPC